MGRWVKGKIVKLSHGVVFCRMSSTGVDASELVRSASVVDGTVAIDSGMWPPFERDSFGEIIPQL